MPLPRASCDGVYLEHALKTMPQLSVGIISIP